MAANFRVESLEANQWRPVIEGIDYTERMLARIKEMGAMACTVWVDLEADETGAGITQQCTPENTRIMVSLLDDDSDCIMHLDPRDGQFFKFFRGIFDNDTFNQLIAALQVWSINVASMTPDPDSMRLLLSKIESDVEEADYIPEDWEV